MSTASNSHPGRVGPNGAISETRKIGIEYSLGHTHGPGDADTARTGSFNNCIGIHQYSVPAFLQGICQSATAGSCDLNVAGGGRGNRRAREHRNPIAVLAAHTVGDAIAGEVDRACGLHKRVNAGHKDPVRAVGVVARTIARPSHGDGAAAGREYASNRITRTGGVDGYTVVTALGGIAAGSCEFDVTRDSCDNDLATERKLDAVIDGVLLPRPRRVGVVGVSAHARDRDPAVFRLDGRMIVVGRCGSAPKKDALKESAASCTGVPVDRDVARRSRLDRRALEQEYAAVVGAGALVYRARTDARDSDVP